MIQLMVIVSLGPWHGACVNGEIAPPAMEEGHAAKGDQGRFDHGLWSAVLSDHVDSIGRVNYAGVRSDERFRTYLFRLSQFDPRGLATSDEKEAFWINAYNALVIQGVLETLPVDASDWQNYSVLKVEVCGASNEPGKGFFRSLKFLVGGRRYFLDDIEKGVLFGRDDINPAGRYEGLRPERPDARIHMAVVCASIGCPPLAPWAFDPERVDEQLDDRVRAFARDESRCRFDRERKVIHLSELMHWYAADFTNPKARAAGGSVKDFLARHVGDAALARSLREDTWKVEYLPYDWRLNLQQ